MDADVELYDDLAGQTALVTGANRGIGERVAADLADLGATVYAGARDPGAVADRHRAVELDVTVGESVAAALRRVEEEAGHLDALVNNAGVHGPAGPLGDTDAAAVEQTLRVNLHGPVAVARQALARELLGDGARVVNVSSGAGQFAGGVDSGHLPYGVSKAGLNAFTDALAAQYGELLVNAVCPGWVRTEMGGADAPRSVAAGADTPVWLARFREGPSGHLWRDRERQPW